MTSPTWQSQGAGSISPACPSLPFNLALQIAALLPMPVRKALARHYAINEARLQAMLQRLQAATGFTLASVSAPQVRHAGMTSTCWHAVAALTGAY